MSEPEDFVMCGICGEKFQVITHTHLRGHDMIIEEYRSEFPGVPIVSGKNRKKMSVALVGKYTGRNSPNFGSTRTEETKVKMSIARTEYWRDSERRRKMSVTMMGKRNPMYGKPCSEEHKANLRVCMAGDNNPAKRPEVRAKLKVIWTSEKRAKKSAASIGKKNPNYGNTFTHTEETKAKMSTSLMGRGMGMDNPMYGKTGEDNPNWQGGLSFLPYCHLFSEKKKEQVRNRWGRICALTDLMRSTLGSDAGLNDFEGHEIFSKWRLSVHHIYGNKMAGCDGTTLVLVPLQRPYNTKNFDGLKLEDHPFYITLFMFKDLERKSREQRINGG